MGIDGSTLRQARLAGAVSLTDMAARARCSKSHLVNVEAGRKTVTPDLLAAYLDLLGDTVRRRAALGALVASASYGVTVGLPTIMDLIRHGFEETAGVEDWAAIVATYEDQFAHLDPSLGAALTVHYATLLQTLRERHETPDLLRAAASLAALVGLWLGNAGHLTEARHHYGTARRLAERSGDPQRQAWVISRIANRGPYERFTIAETLTAADQALALDAGPSMATLDVHGGRVHVHALTGNLTAGRASVQEMRRVADAMTGDRGTRAHARGLLFHTYLESRIGTAESARRAYATAEPALAPIRPWLEEARVYLAMAEVRHGDPQDGITQALKICDDYGRIDVRVLRVAVRDLLHAVPAAGRRTPEALELWRYADQDPGPWESLT